MLQAQHPVRLGESEPARPRLVALLAEPPVAVLLALVAIFFPGPLFLGRSFFFRDIYLWSLPQRARLVELTRSAGLPSWDPFIGGGQPFLEHPNNVALYPTSVLAFVFGPMRALNLEIVLHFALCAVAAYVLARVLRLSRAASFLTACAYAFCGFTLSLGNLLNRLLSFPWLPLLVLCWVLYLQEGKKRWFALAACCGAMPFVAGSPEFGLLFLVFAAAFGACESRVGSVERKRNPTIAAIALAIASMALAAVQLVPAAGIASRSRRGHGIPFQDFARWSLNPARLPELLVPGFLGRTDTLDPHRFFGQRIEDEGFPFILSISFGVLLVGLALGWAGASTKVRRFSSRARGVLLATIAIAFALALGRHLPFWPAIYRFFPFARGVHAPEKLLAISVLPVALLAGEGLQIRFQGETEERRAVRWPIFPIFAVALGAGAALILVSPGFASAIQEFFLKFSAASRPEVRAEWYRSLLQAAGFATAGALVWYARTREARRWQPAVIAGAVVLELFLGGRSLNPAVPADLLTRHPDVAAVVAGLVEDGRFFRDANPAGVVLRAPSDDVFWQYRWNLDTLNEYAAASFGIPAIFHVDIEGLAPVRMRHLSDAVARLPWPRRIPILSAGGVRALISADPDLPLLEPVATLPNSSDVLFHLYRNRTASPRVQFASRWRSVPGEREALRVMVSPDFDPLRAPVIELAGTLPQPSRPCEDAEVRILSETPKRMRARIAAPCDGLLVFSESDNPGWSVWVDGRRAAVLHANEAFSAVPLTEGTHEIERRYVPVALAIGASISVLALVSLAIWCRTAPRASA